MVGLDRWRWWKSIILLCAVWNVVYATTSLVTHVPVVIMSYFVPSYFFLPVFIWLVYGLWKEQYVAWIIGLIACLPLSLHGIAKVIAVLLHGNAHTIIPAETPLQIIGIGAIVTNTLMGILLLVFRDEFSPE
jgi:hypothetical protein